MNGIAAEGRGWANRGVTTRVEGDEGEGGGGDDGERGGEMRGQRWPE